MRVGVGQRILCGCKNMPTLPDVIRIKNGFSFQTGAGGASLATAAFVRKMMERDGITGSFALGGITGYMVDMLEKGLFKKLMDVQGFDLEAIH